jgi:hypothetical protein
VNPKADADGREQPDKAQAWSPVPAGWFRVWWFAAIFLGGLVTVTKHATVGCCECG